MSSSIRNRALSAIARGICRSQRSVAGCLCDGTLTIIQDGVEIVINPSRCHADSIYADMATGALIELEMSGIRLAE